MDKTAHRELKVSELRIIIAKLERQGFEIDIPADWAETMETREIASLLTELKSIARTPEG